MSRISSLFSLLSASISSAAGVCVCPAEYPVCRHDEQDWCYTSKTSSGIGSYGYACVGDCTSDYDAHTPVPSTPIPATQAPPTPIPPTPVPPPPYAQCGQKCGDSNSSHNCDPIHDCGRCNPVKVTGEENRREFRCLSICGQRCEDSSQCADETGCGYCMEGKCGENITVPTPLPARYSKCLGPCSEGGPHNHDCEPESECNTCTPIPGETHKYQCGAGCGKPCTDDRHCFTTGCEQCKFKPGTKNGTCSIPGPGYTPPPPATPFPPTPSPATPIPATPVPATTSPMTPAPPGSKKSHTALIVGIVVPVAVLLIGGIVGLCICRRRSGYDSLGTYDGTVQGS